MSDLHPEPNRAPGSELISDQRVHAALRRAAQLQMESVERMEQQARTRIETETGAEPGGYLREHVEAAAAEAGISPEYLRQALLEQDALGEHAEDLAPWVDRMGNRLLGTRQRSLELSRTIDAEPAAVLEEMKRIFPAHPYGMTLVDAVGGLPLEGGVLVFGIPRYTLGSSMSSTFAYAATCVDLLQLHVSLRAVKLGQKTGCEVTFRGDLRTSTRRNVWAGLGLSGGGGVVGAIVTGAAALAAGAVLPLALAGVAVGAAGMGAASAAGYGAIYRYYLKKMIRELETLLKVIDTSARTGGAFRPPQPGVPPSASDPFKLITG
ncbi:MAG TPA: hypothetical protein VGB15_14950 [Longimicrobium sp.]|jgi:hypothetical protein